MPATSLEKSSRLQLKELEEINEDVKSSILSRVHMLDRGTRGMEQNSSLQVGAKQGEGRAVPHGPGWQRGPGAALQARGCQAGAGWCCSHGSAALELLCCCTQGPPAPGIQQMGIIPTECRGL